MFSFTNSWEMLVSKGYVITIGETYGASQRGGAVMSHLRIQEGSIFTPDPRRAMRSTCGAGAG